MGIAHPDAPRHRDGAVGPGRADSSELPADIADAAVVALAGNQNPDGSWFSSPWIQMPIGRATGKVLRTATWESANYNG